MKVGVKKLEFLDYPVIKIAWP